MRGQAVDNYMLRSSMVSVLLSRGFDSDIQASRLVQEDVAKAVLAELQNYSIDRRTIAIGGSEEIWLNDLMSNTEDSWFSLIHGAHNYIEMMLLAKKPQKILCITSGIALCINTWANSMPSGSVEVTFMNSHGLYAYENYLTNISSSHVLDDYYVVDYQDIVDCAYPEDKYDFIFATAWDIVSDTKLQDACVDSLNSDGILFVSATNNGTKLYRDSFHSHPYSQFHRNLMSKDGCTYHIPAHYGFTVFSKSSL